MKNNSFKQKESAGGNLIPSAGLNPLYSVSYSAAAVRTADSSKNCLVKKHAPVRCAVLFLPASRRHMLP